MISVFTNAYNVQGEELCIKVKTCRIKFEKYPFRISALSPIIWTLGFRGFLQSHQTKGQIILQLGHDHFLPNPSKVYHSSVTLPFDFTSPAMLKMLENKSLKRSKQCWKRLTNWYNNNNLTGNAEVKQKSLNNDDQMFVAWFHQFKMIQWLLICRVWNVKWSVLTILCRSHFRPFPLIHRPTREFCYR
jgi:hypothetical protein